MNQLKPYATAACRPCLDLDCDCGGL